MCVLNKTAFAAPPGPKNVRIWAATPHPKYGNTLQERTRLF